MFVTFATAAALCFLACGVIEVKRLADAAAAPASETMPERHPAPYCLACLAIIVVTFWLAAADNVLK